ncbi:MAG: hypothetical protein WAO35_19955 [Terriglobia bacterium]
MDNPISEEQELSSKIVRIGARLVTALKHVTVIAVLFAIPIPWHEIMGHGLVGVLCGGRVTKFELFGWQLFPQLKWAGTSEGLGICDHTGIVSHWCAHLTDLAGSMSTFTVAAIAAYLLWRYRPRGVKCTALICLTVWALDLLTFTLPSFGLRRYIWSGTRYSEPYTAAVALGIPGPLFQAFVLAAFSMVVLLDVLALAPSSKHAAPHQSHG